MLFNSISFLVFFPLVTAVFFEIPQKCRPLFLLAASYYFYACWSAKYLLLLLASTLVTYASGLLISRTAKAARKKMWVGASFAINLSILFVFKYFGFAMNTIAGIAARLHITIQEPSFSLLLPVGISFYTFQALSYTMDVYRGDVKAEKSFVRYALFVSFFPQLVAGPIERSSHLLGQMSLSSWLRDYLYIPLGGNRKGTLRKCINLMIVFLVSGLWHGAAWHYVVWGGVHGVYQLAGLLKNKLADKINAGKPRCAAGFGCRAGTFVLVAAAWVFFRANRCGEAIAFLKNILLKPNAWALVDGVTLYSMGLDRAQFWLLILAALLLFWVDVQHEKGRHLRKELMQKGPLAVGAVLWAGVMAVLVFGIWGPLYDAAAFIYFQF